MNIIGSNENDGYKRTRPGRSFAISISPTKQIKLGKKISATTHRVEQTRLTRVEYALFSPCASSQHKRCSAIIIYGDGSIPRVCDCKCHSKRRRLPTTKVDNCSIVTNVDTVKHVFVHNERTATNVMRYPGIGRPNNLIAVKQPQLPGLKAITAKYATELNRAKITPINLGKQITIGGKRHTLKITIINTCGVCVPSE